MNMPGSGTRAEDVRICEVRLVCEEGWSTEDVATAATPKLDQKQREKWVKRWQAGPVAAGFLSQLWTGPRVAELFERELGVTYHANNLPALLRSLGMTVQRPTPPRS